MMIMKKWLNIFIYISLGFVVYALWKADYLKVPEIHDYLFLIISIVLLLLGFLSKSIVWITGLRSEDIRITVKDGLASTGLAELGKYIPGKLWAVMGRAMYISIHYPISTMNASAISFNVQVLTIWSGLMVGALGMFFVQVPSSWIILMLGAWTGLSLVIFVHNIHDFFERMVNKIIKRKRIRIPFINVFERKEIILWAFADWVVRLSAFYFFMNSLTDHNLSFGVALGFPLAVTLGILAVIVPGGIGVREGILLVWLKNAGLDVELATTVAITARLWSLSGELGVFFAGLVLKKK
jgi:uncharacterized membrane protein YbhN (UPF0104 family)